MSLTGTWVGRIEIRESLGQGGMGEVYRGFDQKLQREVAVKVIHADQRLGADARLRFLREARILSKLDHPGICRVYDLVESAGRDLLVMELVRGETLRAAREKGLTREEILRLGARTAEALAAAHRQLVVHRDLKPENLMVLPDGGVKVLDFGLARSLEARAAQRRTGVLPVLREPRPRVDEQTAVLGGPAGGAATTDGPSLGATSAGLIVGTIRYMSPEQALGEDVTAASDLYSLGVMLQELLTGRPVYGATEPLDVLEKVARGEVLPPDGLEPELARLLTELESVEPARRPTAAETAERIAAILEAPARRRRRNVRLAVTGAVSAALLAAAGSAVFSRVQAGRQAELAARFAGQARDIEWRMRAEHLAPAHDLRAARADVVARVRELEETIGKVGRLADGPGRLAMGRAWLALNEPARARVELEKAWAAGFRTPDSAYALGVALGLAYRSELEQARGLRDPEVKAGRIARLKAELRDPALARLADGKSSELAVPAFVEGLVALYEERSEAGLAAAARAVGGRAWLYEADLLAGEILLEGALQVDVNERDTSRRIRLLEEAEARFRKAAETGRSDPGARLGLCRTRFFRLTGRVSRMYAAVKDEEISAARAACRDVLLLDPEALDPLAYGAGLEVLQALCLELRGADASPAYEAAVAAATKVLERAPDQTMALSVRANAFKKRAFARAHAERTALADFDRASADLRRLLALRPFDTNTRMNLADCYMGRAGYGELYGEDPVPLLTEGIRVIGEGFDPSSPGARGIHISLASLRTLLARQEFARGRDPLPTSRLAVEGYARGAEKATSPEEHRNLGMALADQAEYLVARGEDPSAAVRAAVEAAEKAIAINPGYAMPWRVRALARFQAAAWAVARTGEPGPELALAVADCEKSIGLPPRDSGAYVELASYHLLDARAGLAKGRGVARPLAAARAAASKAVAESPDDVFAWRVAAELEVLEARTHVAAGRPAVASLAAAGRAVATARQKGDASAGLAFLEAEERLVEAEDLLRRGLSPGAASSAGLKALEEALRKNPRLPGSDGVRKALEAVGRRPGP